LPYGRVVGAEFFDRSSDRVASDLVGKIIWSPASGGGRLTEVEAYLPFEDPASHSACGPTRRNAAMFGPPGTIYVFLSYGVHYLLNFVCDRPEVGSAVLIRAVERVGPARPAPTGGGVRGAACFCGPGRVGRALGIHPGLNGLPLGEPSGLFVVDDGVRPDVGVATRIGISRGAMLPLRYYSCESTCVTKRPRTREERAHETV
jgi:DNA-3-methyladenine glycosylase